MRGRPRKGGADDRHQIRSCVVCKGRAPKADLLRLVLMAGAVVWDREQVCQARGAYLHCEAGCVSRLADTGVWQRSFGKNGGGATRESLSRVMGEIWSRLLRVDCAGAGEAANRTSRDGPVRGVRSKLRL